MEETGIVIKTDGIMATVRVQKKSACEGCAVKGVCESTPEGMEIEALNPVKARVGQSVRISMKPYTYLKGTMIVYGLPLVLFITGAIMGKNIGEKYITSMDSDLVAAICGFVLLALSMLGIKIWSKRAESRTEYKPVIEAIIKGPMEDGKWKMEGME